MSLQVWLPLNGNLNNYGASGLVPVQSTAPTYVNGKIGKAMSTGALYLPAAGVAKFYNGDKMSFAFWIYPTGTGSVATPILGQSNTAAGDCRMFTIYQYPNMVDLHLSWQSEAGGNAFLSPIYSNAFTANTWNHCVITYDNPTCKVYINGVLKQTYTGANTRTNFSYNVPIPSASSRYLNDLRIYDHVLSIKEIRELAKGLVLHYALDNNGYGMANLLPNYGTKYSESTAYSYTSAAKDGCTWLSGSHFIVEPSTTYTFSVCCDGNLAPSHDTSGKDPSLKLFTMWLYLCNSDTTKAYNSGGYDNPVCFNSSNYNHKQYGNRHVWQYTTKSTETHMSVRVNNYSNGSTALTLKYWQIKIEKGSVDTPWIPNSADSNYAIFNINGTRESDLTGYGRHGTLVSAMPTIDSDTPRYSCCYKYAGSTNNVHYNNTTDFNYTDNFSFAFWIKTNYTGTTAQYAWTVGRADAGGYGYGIHCSSTTNCNVRFGNKSYGVAVTGGQWTHLAFTKSGTAIKIYKNGAVASNITFDGTLPTYSDGAGVGIGCFHYASGNIYPFYGNLSDFRIYAAALSADDILELYRANAEIDTNGRIYSSDFTEV